MESRGKARRIRGRGPLSAVLLAGLSLVAAAGAQVSQPPPVGWTHIGPPGGPVAALVFHPLDRTRLYALSSGRFSQLFRSSDAGDSWAKISAFPEKISDLAVSSSEPLVMYALGYNVVYKSVDGGASWTPMRVWIYGPNKIAVDPTDPRIVYATGSAWSYNFSPAVFRSLDGGASWDQWMLSFTAGKAIGLAVNPSRPGEVFVGAGYEGSTGGAIFKSVNGGASWTEVSGTSGWVRSIQVDPADPQRVFAGTDLAVYRSTDAGGAWLVNEGQISALSLTLDTLSPSILYAGGKDAIFKSGDGGIHWGRNPVALAGEFTGLLSAGSRVHAGAGAGLFMSRDGGVTWPEASSGFMASDIKHLAVAPSQPAILYAATAGAAWRSDNCGASWRRLPEFTSLNEAQKFVVHPTDPDYVYAVVRHAVNQSGGFNINILRSRDGGLTWYLLFQGMYLDVAFNPEQPGHVFVGASDLHTMGVAISLDGGATFTVRRVEQVLYGDPMAVAVNPQDDATIYVGGDYWTGSDYQAGIFKSVDGGLTWVNLTTDQFAGWGFIHKIVVDPWRPDIVYLRHNKSFYRSVDGGASWEKAAPFDVEDFALDTAAPDRIYVVGDTTPYVSLNGGGTWEDLSGGLPSQDFATIAVAPLFRTLLAGTTGAGLYKRRQEDLFGLSVFCGNGGQTTPAPGLYTYPYETTVTVTATPAAGYKFKGWEGDAGGTGNPASVNLNDDKAVAARFWLAAPSGFKAVRNVVRNLFLIRHIDVLTWQPLTGVPDLAAYRVYRCVGNNWILTAEVGPAIGTYWHTVIPSSDSGEYALVAVNSAGEEGEPVTASSVRIIIDQKRKPARILIRK